MPPMVRSILAVIAGVAAAFLVVILTDALTQRMYPLPEGTDMANPDSLRQAVAAMPMGTFVVLLVGWIVAAFVASFVAARLATRAPVQHGIVAALLLLAATVSNLVSIPHPTWMWPAAIILLPLAGWAATRIVKPRVAD